MKITKPTLILDEKKCRHNIRKMAEKAREHHLAFRPHFKTHQSRKIGEWFREEGVNAITVSSVDMAIYFAAVGWNDITIAFPVNICELEKIDRLAEKINLIVLIESIEVLKTLNKSLSNHAGVFIKIDTGYHRTGILYDHLDELDKLMREFRHTTEVKFRGFLTHAGNSYSASSTDEIISIHEDSIKKLSKLKQRYKKEFPDCIISIGDTPCCSVATEFDGVDEIRPGNFVFYDVMQYYMGSCKLENIAVIVACPIVSVHPERNEIVIYGGSTHFSKEYILRNNEKIFGLVASFNGKGWKMENEQIFVSSLTQEHGIIKGSEDYIKKIKPGDIIGVLPIHSCLTANLMKSYITLEDDKLDYCQITN